MTKDEALKLAFEALKDMNCGWKYIREVHGDLYGVGWDRAQGKADDAIKALRQALEQPVSFYVYEWVNPSDSIVFRSFRHDEHHMGREPDRTIAVPAPHTCAAPDLLEALETIAEYWDKDTNHDAMEDACWYAINTAEAAIAKARGE